METEFLLRKTAGMLNVSIYRYSSRTLEKRYYSKTGSVRRMDVEEAEMLEKRLLLQPVSWPLIRVDQMKKDDFFVQIRDPEDVDAWYVIGPVLQESGGGESRMESIVSGVLLIYAQLTGRSMEDDEFWEKNETFLCDIQKVHGRVEQDIFERQEQYGPHNPYEQELRELESIRTGDVDALNESISEVYEGKLGILARQPLRHHKNIAIGNITMASRFAIRGGMNKEQSFSMADSFIRQIEDLDTIPEVIAMKREAQREFARAVRQERKSDRRGGAKNPLIAAVKDYIFSHLHDSIQIADIASYLHVNADYLSHLFKVQEHMTMKQYIQEEKIRRGKNLLRYSDVSIHEIAFYLGFSSQSHFTQVFQKITGETPGVYRKHFLNQQSWENKTNNNL